MHGTNVQATIVANTILFIAMSKGSTALLEHALALQAIATGKVCLPNVQSNPGMPLRIVRTIWDTQWSLRAHAGLADPYVQYLAGHFYQACSKCVKVDSNDPAKDMKFLAGVAQLYQRERSMQMLADALLEQLALPDVPVGSPLSVDIPRERLIKYCRVLVETKLHIDRQRKLRKAKEASSPSADVAPQPEQPTIAAPEPMAQAAPAPVSSPGPTPAVDPAIAEVAPANAKPARTPPRTDVMRVVVPWSNCASIPLWQMWLQEAAPESPVHDWVPITPSLPLWTFVHPRAQGWSPPS